MEEVGQAAQLRAGELIIIVVVLVMWAGTVPLQQRTSIMTELLGIHRVRGREGSPTEDRQKEMHR